MGRTGAEHVLPMFCAFSFHGNSMNNLLSYWGLIDAKIRASDKDLPAKEVQLHKMTTSFCHYEIMDVAKGENKTHRVDQSVEKRPKYV